MRIFLGSLIGFVIGAMVWFPYGIMYTVQANDASLLVKAIALLKGVIG
jgi:hypothetical protein